MRRWRVALLLVILAVALWLATTTYPEFGRTLRAVPVPVALASGFIMVNPPGQGKEARSLRRAYTPVLLAALGCAATIWAGGLGDPVSRTHAVLAVLVAGIPSVHLLVVAGLTWAPMTKGLTGLDIRDFDPGARALAFVLWIAPWTVLVVASAVVSVGILELR